mmetsp:Transcript_75545/g.161861  ORF Transcript_75545/g.161861 Transcript_75545/m.161861 type:complete len:207 (-) Transcript_75545:81-701(-)
MAPVPRPIPVMAATAITAGHTIPICGGMQCRMPGILVCLLNIDLGARNAAHSVSIAVVVVAIRNIHVLPHGREVKSSIAAAFCLGNIGGVVQGLPKEVEAHILRVIINTWCADLRKISPGIHVRYDMLIVDCHLVKVIGIVPPRWHNGDRAIATHVKHARAHAGGECLLPNDSNRREIIFRCLLRSACSISFRPNCPACRNCQECQ